MALILIVVSVSVALVAGGAGVWFAQRRARHRAADEARHQQVLEQGLERLLGEFRSQVDQVRQLVDTRVGGVTETVDAKVGGLSKAINKEVEDVEKELRRLTDLVAHLQQERRQQHGTLVEKLEATARQHRELAATTQSLREALANPQARGQWGERMADDVLRLAGLHEGINYRCQTTLPDGSRPDFTFLLPGDRVLHMDVKFPIANYLRHLESDADTDRDEYRKRFLTDVRARVKELSKRAYNDADTTVGFALMFIPNESVNAFIHECDPALVEDAASRGVVLCSPMTLLPLLGVVRQAMDNLAVERASGEILEVLARFTDQWDRFTGQLDKVANHLGTLNNSFGELSGRRRRGLERMLTRIDELRTRVGIDDAPLLVDDPPLRQVSGT